MFGVRELFSFIPLSKGNGMTGVYTHHFHPSSLVLYTGSLCFRVGGETYV